MLLNQVIWNIASQLPMFHDLLILHWSTLKAIFWRPRNKMSLAIVFSSCFCSISELFLMQTLSIEHVYSCLEMYGPLHKERIVGRNGCFSKQVGLKERKQPFFMTFVNKYFDVGLNVLRSRWCRCQRYNVAVAFPTSSSVTVAFIMRPMSRGKPCGVSIGLEEAVKGNWSWSNTLRWPWTLN